MWEGGYREPGIAWWPGRIAPGGRTDALAATYDIFPTVLRLAGAPPPPPSLTIDGIDLAPVLFGDGGKGHECITFYWNAHAATAADPTNLAAMRCKDHKVYWWVQCNGQGCPPAGKGINAGIQPRGRPTVFNLVKDPGESAPLLSTDPDYAPAVAAAEAAR